MMNQYIYKGLGVVPGMSIKCYIMLVIILFI